MIVGAKKVNVWGIQGKASRYVDFNFKKEAKYFDREVAGFLSKC